ncbi:MAG: aminomethyl transferase family protein [Gemmatimonadaceae bacterium]|nr:aminomethyl transferase family protein [Gemmatimonadaceae bacterium]
MTAGPIISGQFPAVGVIAGHSVTLHYGNIAGEYAALDDGAMLTDRSVRGRLRLDGPKAAEMLTGLVTNDVLALTPGHGQYAAALSPKGRIIADVRIFSRADHLLVDVPPRARTGFDALVGKYLNPRVVPYVDVSTEMRQLVIAGVAARSILGPAAGITRETLAALASYSHVDAEIGGRPVMIARVPDLEAEGFELFFPADAFGAIWQRLLAGGARPAGLLAWEIARIENGRPEWGIDIDETTIPQEANHDELHAISYTKGCYTGQEVVARIHFRGHVNRHLRGLLLGHNEPASERAPILGHDGKQVGDVRSSALSPRLGAIALIMVRREIEMGSTVLVEGESGRTEGKVVPLPFREE